MNWKILFEQKILNRGYSYFHDGASFRLFNLKFWIFITGWLILGSAIGLFHPEIDMWEAIIVLPIAVPIFVLLLKRYKSLKQYFDSAEYECKKEDKRRIKAQQQHRKYVEQQRKEKVYRAGSQSKPVSRQKDSSGSGCCLVALFLLIFYAPIKLIAELTKKYY